MVTTLDPREHEATRLVEQRPGITVEGLRDAFGVGRARIWQIVSRLERGRVRLGQSADRRVTAD